ncbi:MAG TPA: signal peptidase II [Acidimicrobiia bacterium]|nr:signal peptidase II [Acidimicrobiia bacterium]
MTSRTSRGTAVIVAVAALVVAVDQLTKAWAVNALADGHDIDLVWTLRLRLTFNAGMAFSQGRGLGPVIGVVAIVVVAALLISLRRTGSTVAAVGVGLVVGGAAGNILDRLFRSGDGFLAGEVVDFIDLQWWPIFNVADAAVVIGGIVLLVLTLRTPDSGSR